MTEPQKTIDLVEDAFNNYIGDCWPELRQRTTEKSREDLRSAFMAGARFGVEAMERSMTKVMLSDG